MEHHASPSSSLIRRWLLVTFGEPLIPFEMALLEGRSDYLRAETIQPTPRNIGRRNAHNTNPSIAPIIPINQKRTLFMRLRLEMDALPRLFDMLLSVLRRLLIFGGANLSDFMCDIFLCVYRLSKFCLLVDTVACGGKEGLFVLWLTKYELTTGRSGDFSVKRQKNSPAPHVYKFEQARLPELILPHNLELRLRDGENE